MSVSPPAFFFWFFMEAYPSYLIFWYSALSLEIIVPLISKSERMKKALPILLTLCLSGIFLLTTAQEVSQEPAQKSRTLNNGFSIKAQIGFPSDEYADNAPVESAYQYGVLLGVQFGNQWYINPKENYGFGFMINWIDFMGVSKKIPTLAGEDQFVTGEVAFLEIGPLGTYAISDAMAIDAYYNLRPTSMGTAYRVDGHGTEAYGGFGFTHAFGAGFRWNVLFLGLEYVLGKVKVTEDSINRFPDDTKIDATSFRILAGVKF